MPWYADVRWIVTAVFAVWGAALSTWQLVIRLRETKPRLDVTFREFVWHGSNPPQAVFQIEIRNVGSLDVHLQEPPCAFGFKNHVTIQIEELPKGFRNASPRCEFRDHVSQTPIHRSLSSTQWTATAYGRRF